MAITIWGRRKGFIFAPADELSQAELEKLPNNSEKLIRGVFTTPRSSQQHRLYWGMLTMVSDAMDRPVAAEALHEWVKLRLGVVEFIPLLNGDIEEVPGSTSFEAMDQLAFNGYLNRAADLLCEFAVRMDKDDLLSRLYDALKIPRPEDYR